MENGHQPATKLDIELLCSELKQDIEQVRSELKQGIEQVRSELKQDIEQVRSELKQDIEQVRSELKQDIAQLRSEFQHGFDDLKEAMRDIQTEILKAFYSVVQSNQTRFATIETEAEGMKKRIGLLEDRILDLERKSNRPPL